VAACRAGPSEFDWLDWLDFHIATAAIATATIAVAGTHARKTDGAVVLEVGAHTGGPVPAAIVGADGDGSGVATGGSGTAGVTW
jgi:hypothetical protein